MFQLKELNPCTIVFASLCLATVITITFASGEYAHNLDNDLCIGSNCPDRSGNGVTGSMWFGPRLGRRRRSGEASKPDDEEINTIADAINTGPWALIAYHGSGDKRHSTQFTPRLGRELGERLLQRIYKLEDDAPRLEDNSIDENRPLSQSPSPFAPRLGRHLSFIPSDRFSRRLRILKSLTN